MEGCHAGQQSEAEALFTSSINESQLTVPLALTENSLNLNCHLLHFSWVCAYKFLELSRTWKRWTSFFNLGFEPIV